jgi:hypothetical protein
MIDVGNLFPLLIIAVVVFVFFKWVMRDMNGPDKKHKGGR